MSTLLVELSNMERFDINYSKKNIPLPSEKQYKLQLTSKVESVIKRMRWKAMQFLGKLDQNGTETYGFKTNKCPLAIEELSEFESDLVSMIEIIQFRPVRNNFLAKLKNDIKEINNTDELLVNADKSTNIYKFSKDQYKKHLCDNVTKTYKKSNRNKVNNINYEAKTLCEKLNIDDYNKCKKRKLSLQLKTTKKVSLIHCRLGLLIHPNLILVK